ncbi:MAG: alpha/beta fold hydrolase [Rhodothermales bacterium]|nr:alpha/beta fold hydrolase [Rhodothermales bacterium]
MRLAFGIYIGLLILSGIVRWLRPEPPPRVDQQVVELPQVEADAHVEGQSVRLAFAESAAGDTPILLLHGSPAASRSMMSLHEALASRGYRVLTPDLPGFGRSTRDIPDYSARAHGRYLLSWMDSLEVESAHAVAYSMSGAVVLEAWERAPQRFRSVIMLSAIGVQELELTGDYHLNHAIHALQLGGLWLLREGTPHFGWLDDAVLGVPYARNFYDTDQRPLRRILERFDGPMQIIHAEDDPLVPVAAAVEHARLVAQAEFVRLPDGGHSLPFARASETAETIGAFVRRAERGEVAVRANADPNRVAEAAQPFDAGRLPPASPFTVGVLMVLVAVATFASEDLASIGSGLMAARGTFTFLQATIAALLGIVIGDVGLYVAGRWLGRPMLARAPFRWFVSSEKLLVGEKWFDEKGIRAVLVARFIPGTRLPTYLAAGVLKAPFFKFFGYFLVAALIWTPAIVGAAMLLGRRVLRYYDAFEAYAIWVVLALVLLLFVGSRVVPLFFSHQGRRRLAGRWKRLTEWEFWPPWVFYPPVLVWCGLLALRYRSIRAPLVSNPAIPHSGFVGESKSAILDGLPAEWVADYMLLEASREPAAGLKGVRRFLDDIDSGFPVVLKPDIGERGRGVTIARTPEDVLRHLDETTGATVVQRYIPGAEFGVFFYRDPETGAGRILSITEKQFPSVTGDGMRTLHELILDDSRAIAMLAVYERGNAKRLDCVPNPGEVVHLVELGTHCRGAVFVDGRKHLTDALTKTITTIADQYTGFSFGRFDLRVPSAASLEAGTGFRILELNGVTSEATHIYDPSNSLWTAYRTLFHQWDLAWRIGRKHLSEGVRPGSWSDLTRTLAAHLGRKS